jgi:hypothetical protein
MTASFLRGPALAAALVLSQGAQAVNGDAAANGGVKVSESPLATGPLKLQKTYIDSGTGSGAALPAFAFTPVGGPVTVNCGLSGGCNVSATLEVQISQVGTNSPALCFYVDDAAVNCPTADRLSATTGFKILSHTTSTLLSMGKHKLEMRAYSELAAQFYRYHAEYRLFK